MQYVAKKGEKWRSILLTIVRLIGMKMNWSVRGWQQLGVDGIEQFIYRDPEAFPDYKELTIGAHLNYWPYWMDFWLRKAKRLQQQFRSIHERQTYFKTAMSCDEWLAVIRRNICAAISQKPEYLVWHVAEADTETIFTFDSRKD